MRQKLRKSFKANAMKRMSHSFYPQNRDSIGDQIDLTNANVVEDFQNLESVTGRIPIRYTTATPSFLKPSIRHPYRRLNGNFTNHFFILNFTIIRILCNLV